MPANDLAGLIAWSVAAITDMLSGQVQVIFDNLPASIEYIKGGNLRALAVTTAALPDLPTVGEFVPGYEGSPCHPPHRFRFVGPLQQLLPTPPPVRLGMRLDLRPCHEGAKGRPFGSLAR